MDSFVSFVLFVPFCGSGVKVTALEVLCTVLPAVTK